MTMSLVLFISIDLALIYFRLYTRMFSLALAMIKLQILLLEYNTVYSYSITPHHMTAIKISEVRIQYLWLLVFFFLFVFRIKHRCLFVIINFYFFSIYFLQIFSPHIFSWRRNPSVYRFLLIPFIRGAAVVWWITR